MRGQRKTAVNEKSRKEFFKSALLSTKGADHLIAEMPGGKIFCLYATCWLRASLLLAYRGGEDKKLLVVTVRGGSMSKVGARE
eukprot:scaffold10077_cov83-Skeletonema_dohrnii-CCMP3373.AAC.3